MAWYQAKKTDEELTEEVESFFVEVSDEDMLRFLRHLVMVWGNDEPMTITDFTYEALLWPYMNEAWQSVKGGPGISSRLSQLSKVFAVAEDGLKRDTGRTRRLPRVTNLAAFMDAYTTAGLPV